MKKYQPLFSISLNEELPKYLDVEHDAWTGTNEFILDIISKDEIMCKWYIKPVKLETFTKQYADKYHYCIFDTKQHIEDAIVEMIDDEWNEYCQEE